MKKVFTLLAAMAVGLAAWADVHVSGIVVDEKGEPVIGASIQVKGSTAGTISDYDGKFEIDVEDNAVLTVSFVGMQNQEVKATSNMRITMKENSEVIQEVVVTGYGNVSKGSFAGSAQAVSAENIEKKAPSEISKALAGEVAGVQVINTSGQPGTNATIRIRGIGSLRANTTPLYIVDGVTYEGDISAIDPGDIASTTILKDATATSLYGSRGANGVIVITTKRGNSGEEGKIDVDVSYGANMHLLPMYYVITSPQEYVEMAWMSIYNGLGNVYTSVDKKIIDVNKNLFSAKGLSSIYNLWEQDGSMLIDGYTGRFRDDVTMKECYKNMVSWEKSIFRVGQKANATVKISGGTDKTTYYTSFGYLKDEGYYIGSDYDRFTVRGNVEHQAKKWLKGGLNIAYTYSSLNNPGQGSNMNNGFAYVNGIPPIYPVHMYNEDGTIKTDPKTGGYAYDYGMHEGGGRGFGAGINPAGALRYDKQKWTMHQLAASANLEVKFYKDLKLEVNLGLQYVGQNVAQLTNLYYGDAAGIGRILREQDNYLNFEAQQLLKYNKIIDEHTIDVMAGHETTLYMGEEMYGQMNRIADPQGLELSNGVQMGGMGSATSSLALESYLAQANYSYAERYMITANYRADGSSKFAKGHRWGHFGSIGVAWMLTNEAFMEDVKLLKDTKIRASWGMLGNQGISSNLWQDNYSIEYVDGKIGYVWTYKGNPELTWERTSTVDVGVEFSLGKYWDAELDFFYKLTDHMLMPRYNASSMGYSFTYINGGKMSNIGAEFQFNVHAVDTRNVKLDIRLNGGHYHNKILELPKNIDDENSEMTTNGGLVVGKSVYDYQIREYAGVDPATGEALYVGYYDADKGGFGTKNASLITDEEAAKQGYNVPNYISDVHDYRLRHPNANIDTVHTTNAVYCGADYLGYTAEPILDGGFGFDLEVYGVTLSASCSYRIGGYGYDNTYAQLMGNEKVGNHNWHVDMRDMWTENHTNTTVPRLNNGADPYTNYSSTRFLTSNSFLSLNSVRLGYKFPKKLIEKIKMKRLELYVQGDNLAIATARKGYNPMVSATGASNSYQYTPLSTVMGGIKVQF